MKIIQVKCPKCNQPLYSKQSDVLFFCERCETIHTRESGTPKILDFEIGAFTQQYPGGIPYYMPFWRLYSYVRILSEQVHHSIVSRLQSAFSNEQKEGAIFIYVPAIDMDTETFKHWCTVMTFNPPRYTTTLKFNNITRLPCTLMEKEAEKLADFVILTHEAEKPGILQYINYDVEIKNSKLIYLPFYMVNNQWAPGF